MPNKYIAVCGRKNLLSAAAGYLLGLQDHALVSKVCGPNSHACETPIQLDEPLERNVAFNMYFGADEKLFEMCRSRLQGDVDTFEEEGVPLDKQQHPNIPPTRVAL